MTIVCGTDFSRAGKRATRVAARLAAARDESLAIIHVLEDLGAELTLRDRPRARVLFAPEQQRLDEAVDAARRSCASVSAALVPGEPARVLATHAAVVQASLLVVGHVGDQRHRWLIGSVAERLGRASKTPVLVVRSDAPFEAWTAGRSRLRVVLGIDRTETSRGTLRWLRLLNDIHAIELSLVHVTGDDADTVERSLSLDLRDDLAVSQTVRADLIVKRPSEPTTTVAEELVAHATRNRAELVVVGAHQRAGVERWWHGSVSRAALRRFAGNVLVVPTSIAVEESRLIPVIRDVLVATDFSEIGNRGVLHASSLLPDGGTLHVAHVLRTPSVDPDIVHRLHESLATSVPRDVGLADVRVETHVLEGENVADELCALADRLAVDAICMATHARSRVAEAVVDSTARQVLVQTERPVFVIRSAAA